MKRAAQITLAALGLALAAFLLLAPAASAKGQKQPNIVFFTSDDQPLGSFDEEWMPNTFRELVDRGTRFTDAVVNEPLCCPSRATLLTGQYGHNHGILTNTTGYPVLVDPRNVLPAWLSRAGYRTGHFGKWLHGYESVRGTKPAPGWDRWVTQQDTRRYYDYEVSVDGKLVEKGSKPRDHVTSVTTRAAARFVKKNVGSRDPLFMQVDYFAPHESDASARGRCAGAPEPVARDKGAAAGVEAPRGPSFNEEDVSDKPPWARLGEMSDKDIKDVDRRWRCIVESMLGVDRGIGTVIDRFRKANELRNTAFVFLTDNGYFSGQHRIREGKSRPWEEAIRTPLAMRLPRSVGNTRDVVRVQAAGIDIAPTLLDLAGAEPCIPQGCRTLDGRSLMGPVTGDSTGFAERAVLIEMAEEKTDFGRSWACAFQAIRTADDILVESTQIPDPQTRICEEGAAYEYYDLAADPFQLENLVPEGSPLALGPSAFQMLVRLNSIRDCAGIEGRDPVTAGGFCE